MPSLYSVWKSILKRKGRFNPGWANGAPALPRAPFFMTEEAAQHAIRRESRAMASAVKHGREPSDIASHITRNAGLAHKQLAQTQKGAA